MTKDQLVSLGCPPPTYIKEGEEEAGPREGAPKGGVLLGLPVKVQVALILYFGVMTMWLVELISVA